MDSPTVAGLAPDPPDLHDSHGAGQPAARRHRRWRWTNRRWWRKRALVVVWGAALAAALPSCTLFRGDPQARFESAESARRAGDFRRSLDMAQAGMRLWKDPFWYWRFSLLATSDLLYLGENSAADQLLKGDGIPVPNALVARRQMELSRVMARSDADKGKTALQEALKSAQSAGDAELKAEIQLRLSEVVQQLAAADRLAQDALDYAEKKHDPFLATWAQMLLGYNLARFARF